MFITGREAFEKLRRVGPIPAVIHAEHDSHHGGVVGDHIALEPDIRGPTFASPGTIARPTRMDKTDSAARESGRGERLDENGIQPLIGYAIAVEDDCVAVL